MTEHPSEDKKDVLMKLSGICPGEFFLSRMMAGKCEPRCLKVFFMLWQKGEEEQPFQNDGLGNSVDKSPG